LAEDLAAFLSREEVRKIIAAYIDENDTKIIAAIALLEEPTLDELERFFAGDLSYGVMHSALVNLEERFVVYRFQDGRKRHLALNPVLAPVLEAVAFDTRCLFPSRDPADVVEGAAESGAASGDKTLDDRVFAAFFAFVLEEPEFFKTDAGNQTGSVRKKALERGKRLFPGMDIPCFIGTMHALGVLKAEPEATQLCPDKRRLLAFEELSRKERLAYYAAAFYLFRHGLSEEALAFSYLHRTELRTRAAYITSLFELLTQDRLHSLVSLKRFALLLEWEESDFDGDVSTLKWDFDLLLSALEAAGLVQAVDAGWWKPGVVTPQPDEAAAKSADDKARPALVMDTAFSFVLYPEISLSDALALAAFSTVLETGATARFELTRQSVIRGFDQGQSAKSILALFDRLSLHKIDPNLEWTLNDWEKRYEEVSLDEGVVLTLAENRRYLVETGPLAALVRRALAPGVYLLSAQARSEAAETLRKAGVDIIAQRNVAAGETFSRATGVLLYPPVSRTEDPMRFVGKLWSDTDAPPESDVAAEVAAPYTALQEDAVACKVRFRAALDGVTLSREARDALITRIERRLILTESQLTEAAIRYEKLEARGLDYSGKIALAKQAISAKSFIEVFCPSSAGNIPEGGLLAFPEALEKQGNESVLVIRPCGDASEKTPAGLIRLPLGKISLLRRIKSSIFEE
jgi:hypothetical protein